MNLIAKFLLNSLYAPKLSILGITPSENIPFLDSPVLSPNNQMIIHLKF